ncbi:TPA: apolipoprotein N-acyltransferase [bacterium]|nr:apolipoprotein N-acyltransferase [bacterium]
MAYLLVVLSGILLFLSYPPFDLFYLAFLALVPLLLGLKGKSPFEGAILGFIFGLIFFGGLFFWMNSMELYELKGWTKSILWILLSGTLSLYPAIFGFLVELVSKRLPKYIPLSIPFFWCGLEFIRAHFPLDGFPWGLLGHSQYLNLPLIQIASFIGVFGISFLIILSNVLLSELIISSSLRRKFLLLTFYFLPLILCYTYGRWVLSKPLPSKNLKVAAIQGAFDIKMSWDWYEKREEFRRRLEELTKEALPFKPALVIWTETIILDPLGHLPDLTRELASLTKESDSLLLIGAPHFDYQGRRYNSAFLLSPCGRILERYDKVHLVPFGEMLPGERLIPGLRKLLPMVQDFTPGKDLTLFKVKREYETSFGVLICFEDIFGRLVRRFVRKGADFMVNITNDSWSKSEGLHYQHFQNSIFRAIENRIYILRAGNTGVSGIIDPYGRTESLLPINTPGIVLGSISTSKPNSFYTQWGDLFSYFCLLGGVILVFRSVIPVSSKTKPH